MPALHDEPGQPGRADTRPDEEGPPSMGPAAWVRSIPVAARDLLSGTTRCATATWWGWSCG